MCDDNHNLPSVATLMPINSQLPLKTLGEKTTGMPMLNKMGREGWEKDNMMDWRALLIISIIVLRL